MQIWPADRVKTAVDPDPDRRGRGLARPSLACRRQPRPRMPPRTRSQLTQRDASGDRRRPLAERATALPLVAERVDDPPEQPAVLGRDRGQLDGAGGDCPGLE